MNIYISGISGSGMGPLAELAQDAGYQVFGSDLAAGAITDELVKKNIKLHIGAQSGAFLRDTHQTHPLDLFVYTSSLPPDHPELLLAKELGLKTVKRDFLINLIIKQKSLRLIAISGTHGKTTTTALIIWLFHELNLPLAYLVGSTLPFGAASQYQPGAQYFIYEADEYDRNFLNFRPHLAVIPAVSYDHADTYPTKQDYLNAFAAFRTQSEHVIENIPETPDLTLPGPMRRHDASLAIAAVHHLTNIDLPRLIAIANRFPGVGRRFETIAPHVYSDYAHHPEEISATIDLAQEVVQKDGLKGLAVIYQPHQNARQHRIRSKYKAAFTNLKPSDKVFWLSTFVTREKDPTLPILTPEQLSADIKNASPAAPNDELAEQLKSLQAAGYLILLMTAGPADLWIRTIFSQ